MAIYKVYIETEGGKTIYRVNTTELVSIDYIPDVNKYEVTFDHKKLIVTTAKEADKTAREKITNFFARLGIVPNFIVEQAPVVKEESETNPIQTELRKTFEYWSLHAQDEYQRGIAEGLRIAIEKMNEFVD